MKTRSAIVLLATAMVLAACSPSGDTSEEATTTTSGDMATTVTTEPAETTTTEAVETTTTEDATSGNTDLDAFLDSLAEAAPMSARVEGLIEMTGLQVEDGPSEVSIPFSASFDNNTGNSSFLIDMSTLAASMPSDPNDPFGDMADLLGDMEMRQIGDTVYLKFGFFTTLMGAQTEWVSMPAEEGDEFTSGFNMAPGDPREIVEAYQGAPATVDNLGTEEVNGVSANHYRITYDLEQMEMTDDERAELENSGLFADGLLPVDLWISDEGHMVRMVLTVDGTAGDLPDDEAFETMTMRYDLFDINQPVTIDPPDESEVTDFSELGFGFGGTGDTGGG